ncbi:MAG: hypothetical protein FWE55_05185, partial [Synergistaceae bacterium]|nr:hypothetical protein [Synergistaceae bacterium]
MYSYYINSYAENLHRYAPRTTKRPVISGARPSAAKNAASRYLLFLDLERRYNRAGSIIIIYVVSNIIGCIMSPLIKLGYGAH